MKISVEFKDKKYTVTYGTISATAGTVKEAVEQVITQFSEQIKKFFIS